MEQIQRIAELQANLGKLGHGDRRFASDLISAFHRYGKLTPNQAPWIAKLMARAENPADAAAAPKIDVGSFAGVIALFTKAKAHLKYPKITLDCDGTEIILSLCGPKSKTPGSINVGGPGVYPAKPWYGRITPEGQWSPSRSAEAKPGLMKSLLGLLTEFGNDPAGIAKKYGVLTGNCCFCNLRLTDLRSTAAGFGPTCAEHYGLKDQWKAAAEAVKVAA
jgi:hypothetical protein